MIWRLFWFQEWNSTFKSIYIQIGFIWNVRESENICSSEVLHRSISVSTDVENFVLKVSTDLMTCYSALADIMEELMKTTHPNWYSTNFEAHKYVYMLKCFWSLNCVLHISMTLPILLIWLTKYLHILSL